MCSGIAVVRQSQLLAHLMHDGSEQVHVAGG